MTYQFDFGVIRDRGGELLLGCLATLQLSAAAIVGSLLIAVVLSLGLRSEKKALHLPINAFIEVVRNTPFLVQIFLLFFGLPMLGVRLSFGYPPRSPQCSRSPSTARRTPRKSSAAVSAPSPRGSSKQAPRWGCTRCRCSPTSC
jgi:His/Glu/Gln/Arg/opine family amino acid ABC transporter permease subunit